MPIYTVPALSLYTSIGSNSNALSKRVKPTSFQPLVDQVQISTSALQFLERFHRILCDFYLRQYSSNDAWPPPRSDSFVQLALVRHNKRERHIGLQTIQTDVDEDLRCKSLIAFGEIFLDIDPGMLVLFEGRSGSGKTTLMVKISHDWARGLILVSKLVLLVQLRCFDGKSDVYLHDLLRVACGGLSSEDVHGLSSYIEKELGEGVVFILDGFDEYAPGTSDDSFISKLILKSVFSRSIVIVSSRPAATQRFRQCATKWIEVVGFMKEQVMQYVNTSFEYDNQKAQQLLEYLEKHPHLMNLCYLPLHCATLVFLYEVDVLPTTETDLYKNFALSTLFRSFRRRKASSHPLLQLTSFNKLPDREKFLFDKICKLAFHATVNSRQILKHSELQAIFSDGIESDEDNLDLVAIDRYFVRYGLEETYSFVHLTFQEFLAAVHLASLSESQRNDLVSTFITGGGSHLAVNMLRFLCGTMDFSRSDARDIFKLIISGTSGDILFHIACAYEAQNSIACNQLLQDNCLHISDAVITVLDMMHIAYIINSVDSQSPEIFFNSCKFYIDEATALLKEVGSHHLSLTVQYVISSIVVYVLCHNVALIIPPQRR